MLFALLFVSLSFAQEEILLPDIKVQEAKGPLLQQTSSPIYRVIEEELQENRELQDVLSKAPGVMFAQSGGPGAQGTFFLRGGEGRHTLMLVDGMRLNDPTNVNRSFDTGFFQTPFFQDLLLVRGPAPTLYGSDAIGGVIEMVPRRGHTPKQTVLSAGAGSFDTLQGFAIQDWSAGNHAGSFGISHFQTNGFSRLNKKRYDATERDGAKNTQIMQASRHQWNKQVYTDLLAYGYIARSEIDNSFNGDVSNDRTDNQLGNITQTTHGIWGEHDWWVKTGIVSQKRDSTSTGMEDETYRGEFRVAQIGTELNFKPVTLITGVDAQQEWQGSPGIQKQNDLAALFTLARYSQEKWSAEVGARGEQHQRYGGFFTEEGTLTFNPIEELKLHGKAARGYKAPSLYQLYGPDTYGPLGNTELVPETNTAMEVGVEWKREGVISLVAFQQDYQDLIDYTTTDGYQNRGTLRVQGLEAMVISPMHSWGQMSVSWTQLDFSYYSKTPLRRPPYLVTTSWMQEWGKWSTELSLRAVGSRFDNDNNSNQVRLTAYELLSGSVRYSATESQQWILLVGNMTDRKYEDVWGYNTAPVNASVQWVGRF